jgi:hypothetical protein
MARFYAQSVHAIARRGLFHRPPPMTNGQVENSSPATSFPASVGVVGAYSSGGTASVGNISKRLFTRNTIEATSGDLWVGLIYTDDDLTITDSAFTDNTFTHTLGDFGGT